MEELEHALAWPQRDVQVPQVRVGQLRHILERDALLEQPVGVVAQTVARQRGLEVSACTAVYIDSTFGTRQWCGQQNAGHKGQPLHFRRFLSDEKLFAEKL
jgi:hypothetical protein